jgi:hypothetical protein
VPIGPPATLRRPVRLFAYLDPGSGSMVLQMLLGGAASLAVALKMFGKRLFSRLAFWKKDEVAPAPTASVDSENDAA